jgi:hypothetical protein
MPDHPMRVGILDLDPESASQWGIEPEDAYTMLVTPAEHSAALALYYLLRGLGLSLGSTGLPVHAGESAVIPRLR